MKRQATSRLGMVRSASKKLFGFLIVILVLAFVFYHLYSVANFAKNFDKSTGLHSGK